MYERCRARHYTVLNRVKNLGVHFSMHVCVGLGPAFKQLHSYVDDLAQVCSAVHLCDPPACSDSTPLYYVHHLLCSTLLPCTEHEQV